MTQKTLLRTLLTFSALLVLFSSALAQKKLFGVPEAFVLPKDYFDNSEFLKKYLYDNVGTRSKVDAWLVYSDRNGNKVYSEANESSASVATINFRELFYVVDEEGDFVRIARATSVNKLKAESITPVGWIRKDKMLLWSSGLVGEKTGIHRKAFLMNSAENIERIIQLRNEGKHLEAEFFADPQAMSPLESRNIYDHYFVYKKENGMVLLAEEAVINAFNCKTAILGWVDERRIKKWNTRISLAPNFEQEAFDERKADKWNQFRAFDSPENVAKYYKQQGIEGVLWDNDPITFPPSEMAQSDPLRFPGNTIRFPLFSQADFDGATHIRSGVIGGIRIGKNEDGSIQFDSQIPEHEYNQIKGLLSELSYKAENVNVFFVIEGTDETLAYKESVVAAIESLKENEELNSTANTKFGALIYRDVPEGERVIEFERLESNIDNVINFVREADFVNKVDQDAYTAMYYGLQEAMKVAGFRKTNTNIVVMIGSAGDFRADRDRKAAASEAGSEFFLNEEAKLGLYQNLSDLSTHLFGIQLSNANRPGVAFGAQCRGFILESAKYQYNKSQNNEYVKEMAAAKEDMELVEPSIDDPRGKNQVVLKGSRPGQILLPSAGKSLSASNIAVGLNEMISSSINFESLIADLFGSTYGAGKELDIKKFSEEGGIAAADLTSEVLKIYEEVFSKASGKSDYVMQSTEEKLLLYTDVYLPTKAMNSKYPMGSFVLYMPETDLINYQRLINRNVMSAGSGTYDQKRQAIYEMYLALIGQFASQDVLKNKKPEDFSRKEVMELMQGIEGEGLDLEMELDVSIGDILDEKVVSNPQIDELIQRFVKTSETLQLKLSLRDRDDFCYKSDNANYYYWLKLDEVEF